MVRELGFGLREVNWRLGLRRTHLDVEADCLGQLFEHFFQCCKRGLDEVSAAISFEALLFEISCMLHAFTHLARLVFVQDSKR